MMSYDFLTLGDLIDELEVKRLGLHHHHDDTLPNISFSFAYMIPTTIHSWRGAYADLAIGYRLWEGGVHEPPTVEAFLTMLKNALGKQFEGYKGGHYLATPKSKLWVANVSESCQTGIHSVIETGDDLILETCWREW